MLPRYQRVFRIPIPIGVRDFVCYYNWVLHGRLWADYQTSDTVLPPPKCPDSSSRAKWARTWDSSFKANGRDHRASSQQQQQQGSKSSLERV